MNERRFERREKQTLPPPSLRRPEIVRLRASQSVTFMLEGLSLGGAVHLLSGRDWSPTLGRPDNIWLEISKPSPRGREDNLKEEQRGAKQQELLDG